MARKINFGKYKGKTIEELLKDNPAYLLWAYEKGVKGVADKLTQSEIDQLKNGGNTSTKHNSDGKTQLQVTCVGKENPATKENMFIMSFYGLDKNDAFNIRGVLDKNDEKNVLNAIIKNDALVLKISGNKLDDFLNTGMKTIQSVLLKSGKYNSDEVMHLEDEAYARAGNGIERGDKVKDYRESKTKAIEVWQQYIKTLNDPETVKLIDAYSTLPTEKIYGHTLSQKNAMLIRSVDSDATFILPLSEWRKLNRGVRRGAKRYVIYIMVGDKKDQKMVTDVIQKLGWGKLPYDELPPQVQKEVDIQTNGVASNIFVPVYEYDIRDTYVFPGQPDLFNQTIGLKNNLTGELNALAKMDSLSSENAPKPDEVMEQRTIKANEQFSKYCDEKGIKYVKSQNASMNLVNALEANYKQHAINLDILRDTNINMFAENATHITLLIGKYAYNMLSRFTHGNEYTKKEVGEMINAVGSTLRLLNDKSELNEAIDIRNDKNFIKEFMDAFFEIGCRIKNDTNIEKPSFNINQNDIQRMVAESLMNVLKKKSLNEEKRLIDNFDAVKKFFNLDSNDNFYFVQIIKRFKDNPNMDKTGNYHAGGEYLQSWKVFSYDELLSLKDDIIKACETQNARAYMTINPRSQSQIKAFVSTFRRRFKPTDPRYIHAEEILAGQTKGHWDDRPILFLDIDTTDKRIHNDVSEILKRFGIDELFRYTTPNGGLHIVLPNKGAKYMKEVIYLFNKYDNYRNKGRLATVHPNNDGKIILYSNVDAKGY